MTDVFYFSDHMFMLAEYKTPQTHRHIAKHLIFSLDNNMECCVDNETFTCGGICIDSNIKHTIHTGSKGILVFLFDEARILASELKKIYLRGKNYSIISNNIISNVIHIWEYNNADARKLDKEILMACGLNTLCLQEYDKRIITVLDEIAKAEGIYEDFIEKLCSIVYLSQSRLSHLFKEQVGVSLASFLVFEKMRKTYFYAMRGESLTEAAVNGGFGSSAHFSATCKKMFGLSFTDLSINIKS